MTAYLVVGGQLEIQGLQLGVELLQIALLCRYLLRCAVRGGFRLCERCRSCGVFSCLCSLHALIVVLAHCLALIEVLAEVLLSDGRVDVEQRSLTGRNGAATEIACCVVHAAHRTACRLREHASLEPGVWVVRVFDAGTRRVVGVRRDDVAVQLTGLGQAWHER